MYGDFLYNDSDSGGYSSDKFEKHLNDLFEKNGIGWQMSNGIIVTRGSLEFEQAIKGAGDPNPT